MEGNGGRKAVSGVDIIVGVFILIIGIIVVIYGFDWFNVTGTMSSSYGGTTNPTYMIMSKIPWILLFIGITTIIYSIKRMIDDVVKILM